MTQKGDIAVISADSTHIAQIAELEGKYIPDGWSENALRDALDGQRTIMLAAVDNNTVIGFINGSYVLDEGELLNIAVDEKYRRQGIAGMLTEEFEKRLKSFGACRVFLEVREGNAAAIEFYKKNNYKKNGLRKNYYRSPNENAVLMVKEL